MTPTELTGKATNLELARWLAQGNGQVRKPITKENLLGGTPIGIDTNYVYDGRDTDYPCDEYDYDITVRKWGDPTWHEPTRNYMYMDMSLKENVSTKTQNKE